MFLTLLFFPTNRAERKKYYKHGLKAKGEPKKYLLITIDGMDQAKHNLPPFTTTSEVNINDISVGNYCIF